MSLDTLRFLVVEDDQSFGAALKETLERGGGSVVLTASSSEAMEFCRGQNYDFIIIDCLLPGMTGVDLAQTIRNMKQHAQTKMVLMSGIFTDQNFVQEALKLTKALTFLKKPFDTAELLTLIDKEKSKRNVGDARKSLYQTFAKEIVSDREKKKLIESLESVSGYDLPFIYSMLSQTKSSGHLNIYAPDKSVFGVTFAEGCIVGVDIEDTKTYLGAMLIESGYVRPDDVQHALNDKSPRKIGQKLIDNYKLSPHAFDLVLMDQMNLRLSRTISEASLKINFSLSSIELTNPCIDGEKLQNYLHDWIASKIPTQWLKTLYSAWFRGQLVPTSLWDPKNHMFQSPLLKVLPGIVQELEKKPVLSELARKPEFSEVALYKGLHFLLTSGFVYLQINERDIMVAEDKNDPMEEQKKAEIMLQAGKLLEQARGFLQLSQYSKALGPIQEALQLNSSVFHGHTMMAWAKIGTIDPLRKAQQLKEVEIELMQIPADEKYDATYSFVMGLYHKANGEAVQSRKSFEKALALDNTLMVARRELSLLEAQNRPKGDLLNRDLKDVISGFFKKK
ncbi:MAG: response regulator [Bdellovibrionota bacterium]